MVLKFIQYFGNFFIIYQIFLVICDDKSFLFISYIFNVFLINFFKLYKYVQFVLKCIVILKFCIFVVCIMCK